LGRGSDPSQSAKKKGRASLEENNLYPQKSPTLGAEGNKQRVNRKNKRRSPNKEEEEVSTLK